MPYQLVLATSIPSPGDVSSSGVEVAEVFIPPSLDGVNSKADAICEGVA